MYECLTGQSFQGSYEALAETVPDQLKKIVVLCTCADKAGRYKSVSQLRAELTMLSKLPEYSEP